MATLDERIEAKLAEVAQLKERKAQVEARKRATEAKRKRSDDTRRKVLAGAAILSLVESGGLSHAQLAKMLDGFLTRPADRALFDLPATPQPGRDKTIQTPPKRTKTA